jgi:glycosyltransferase involved in cell wall biosynthesis
MLNVFLIVHNFSGAKTYADELSGYLVGNKDVYIFKIYLHYPDSKEFRIWGNNQITTVCIPEKINKEYDKKYYKRAAQLVFCHFQNLQNVVLHANMPEQYYFVKEAKELFRCPLVFTFHFLMSFYSYYDKISGYADEIKDKGNDLEKYMLEFADHIICVTKFSQRAITKLQEVDPTKTSVIYNGKSIFNGSPEKVQNLKIHYGFSPDDRIILYAGQLEPRKGIDKLIKAFLLIKEWFPTTKLVIAGTGEYDSYMPLAQECTGRICFPGKLDKNVLYDFYRFSEMGIIPSQYEQCSYVAIEMMQHGLPLIISDVPGLNELVTHKETGLVCKTQPHSTIQDTIEAEDADLAIQIEYLLSNKETGLKLAIAARKQVLERHSLKNMGEKTQKIYLNLLKNDTKNSSINQIVANRI